MFGFHAPELIILLVVALVIFGPKRLPEIGGALGKGIKEFKKGTAELHDRASSDEPVQIPPVQSGDVRVPEPPVETVAVTRETEVR